MKSALIINNSPKCPYCFESDYGKLHPTQADVAIVDGKRHYEMTMLCHSCMEESYYFLDTEMNRRYDISKDSGRYKRISGDE